MKVLAFADFPSPYRVEVFRGLAQKYKLTIFFDKMSDQNRNTEWFCKDSGLDFYSLLEDEGYDTFIETLKEINEYDLVLAYDYHIKNAIKLQLSCIRKKVPYIMNLDGAFIRRNPVKNLVKRYLIKYASGYFASGSHAKEYFRYFRAKEEKVFLHPFTSLFENEIYNAPASIEEKKKHRIELGLENRPTVISIGQFIHRKGFDILIKAWKDLDETCQMFIIGGGKEKKNYQDIISAQKYNHVYLIDYQPKELVFKYYRAADIFVLPTREDIWGLVINEAMACGLPVISTNMCLGAVELIEDGVNGYIIPVDNSEKIHDAIKIIINECDLYKIGVENLNKIKKYTYENVIKAHIEAIEQIMHGELR